MMLIGSDDGGSGDNLNVMYLLLSIVGQLLTLQIDPNPVSTSRGHAPSSCPVSLVTQSPGGQLFPSSNSRQYHQ